MKNVKMKTRLIGAFGIAQLLTIINVVFGIMSIRKIAAVEGNLEERYASSATIFAIVILAISLMVTIGIGLSVTRAIDRSVKQLSDAAKEIALGRGNGITLVKYANDEFGELGDEYGKVLTNIR
ncbi:MAG: cell wall metabolism sensor histidine kinase WalK, partial [Lachnospiraceae bacterium]|nr:cell wall metabolism sensor histidine kinase WalK [Lachnospiraceae bacterium]